MQHGLPPLIPLTNPIPSKKQIHNLFYIFFKRITL